MNTDERPLLFLDVDGPLLPFGATADAAPGPVQDGNPLLARLDPTVGTRLLALGCELVWATTWGHEANEVVAPLIGLPPPLPVLEWPAHTPADGPHGLHWKTRPIVAWAGSRPFIWVDDEIGPMDRQWVEAQHPAPALLHRVDPSQGLTEADFSVLAQWLRETAP
ncbi:HAD domain-containing protein [Streptomyces sp. BH106]|uniref:HAD domain-containing protein n=1 Tax=Streptomyces sp. BH106 TaxID=3410409 RepID=UPI003CE8EE16